MFGWSTAVALSVIVLFCLRHHLQHRNTYRPLSRRQPARKVSKDVPLGLEAIDMRAVNSAARRNESLERSHTSWTRKGGLLNGAADTDVQPLADDETYARRFHAAFMKDKD